jgi:hypothetical protein
MIRTPSNKLGVGVAAILCAALLAPAAIAAEGAADIPRRADGKPDLSGTYDTKTLTPFQRPDHYGERLELTKEEADEIAEHWRKSFEKDYQPSDPDREAPPVGGTDIYAAEFTGAAGKVGGYNAFFVDIGENTFQIDGKFRTSILTDPPNGKMPPLSAEGKERAAERAKFRHENTGTAWWLGMEVGPYDDPELRPLAERCISVASATGPPARPGMYNNLKRIVQTDDLVMINVEWMHDTRMVRMNSEHKPETMRSWTGDSIGWWEGDTLVVDTTNFLERAGFHKDYHAIERFTRTDENTLLYQFTIDDPNYEQPYSGEYPWPAANGRLYEYACHEGNYAMGGILRGARLLEREGLEKGEAQK